LSVSVIGTRTPEEWDPARTVYATVAGAAARQLAALPLREIGGRLHVVGVTVVGVRDEPAELPCELVAGLLRRYWGPDPVEVSYAPVGFGSYHWIASHQGDPRWFVTVDYLDPGGSWLGPDAEAVFAALTAAAGTTRALAEQGCEYVLAPVPDRAGVLVRRVLPRWAMQVFPYLAGWSTPDGPWEDPEERRRIAAIVGRLHAATPPPWVRRWEFAVPGRIALMSALDELAHPWTGGPYTERTRALLMETQTSIRARFRRYDELADEIEAAPDPWVVTHGEPHSANVIRTGDDRMCLIDWDTVALAPRERDLAAFLDGSADVLSAYQQAAGPVTPRPAALELFALWWVLAEICGYVQLFRHPHPDSADSTESWRNLCHYALQPAEPATA
jgi:spectinomycin phosphotransferase